MRHLAAGRRTRSFSPPIQRNHQLYVHSYSYAACLTTGDYSGLRCQRDRCVFKVLRREVKRAIRAGDIGVVLTTWAGRWARHPLARKLARYILSSQYTNGFGHQCRAGSDSKYNVPGVLLIISHSGGPLSRQPPPFLSLHFSHTMAV